MDKKKEELKNEYTVYDFDRPDKFSFENLRSLDSVANAFSRNFSTNLSAFVRLPVEIEVMKVEQVPFGSDYLDKKNRDEYVFCITDFADKEQIIIQFDVGFLLRVHNKQLGADFGTIEKTKKAITIMEKLTMEQLLEDFLYPPMTEAFKTVGNFHFELHEIETDPQYAKVTVPQDMIALITFDVRLGSERTQMQIAIPFLSIERYIEKLNVDNVLKHRQEETSEDQYLYLLDHLYRMEKDFEVELGEINISFKELRELEEGVTLVLGPITKPLVCKVGGKPKFHGKIGKNGNKKAVKITALVQENPIDKTVKGVE